MYGWIWRHLPFGIPGKIIGSLLLLAGALWLLWHHVFPAAEPLLPFDDVVVENGPTEPGADTVTDDPGSPPDDSSSTG